MKPARPGQGRPPARPAAAPAPQYSQPAPPTRELTTSQWWIIAATACAVCLLLVLNSGRLADSSAETPREQTEPVTVPPEPQATKPKPPIPVSPNEPAQSYFTVPPETIAMALKRNVYITAHDRRDIGYSGSGARIGHGLILTARHVVFEKKDERVPMTEIEVDHVAATVAAEDLSIDTAILKVPDDGIEAIAVVYDPELLKLNTPVVFIGNPRGRKNTLQTGYISRLESPNNGSDMFEILTFDADHGISGSSVYTLDGRLIGLSQRGDADDTIRLAVLRNLKPVQRLLETLKGIR